MTDEDLKLAELESKRITFNLLSAVPCMMTAGERLALFSFVYNENPVCALEIGTALGGSAAIIVAAMDALPNSIGHLVCVDPQDWMQIAVWDIIKHRTTLIIGRSPMDLPTQIFDFILIDGNHGVQDVLSDLNGIKSRTRMGSAVVLHDALNPGVAEAISEFLARLPNTWKDCGFLSQKSHYQGKGPDGGLIPWGGLQVLRRIR